MTCILCKKAATEDGTATVALKRGGLTSVLKAVSAAVGPICGEAFVEDVVAGRLLEIGEETNDG